MNPSSRVAVTRIRIGPSRSPSRLTRSSNVANWPSRKAFSFGAKVKPGGVASAHFSNCASAGIR